MEPVPSEYLGYFDVVHVRLLVCALSDPRYKDPNAIIRNFLSLLKPNGLLQWCDYVSPYMAPVGEDLKLEEDASICKQLKELNRHANWLSDLPAMLEQSGFVDVKSVSPQPALHTLKHESDTLVIAVQELNARIQESGMGERADSFQEATKEVLTQAQQDQMFTSKILVVIGRRPERQRWAVLERNLELKG
ncbi:hypothetical protein F5884DRAFT_839197 [Xylogone sp. PMI_703]|nr:hypothetical protein F5884DRAFT_839197 [Xylogone sp. PMI_703]